MLSWNNVPVSSFLKERDVRYTPSEANKLSLKRLEKIDFSGKIHLAADKQTKTGMILVKKGDLVISGINIEKGAVAVYEGEEDILATIHYSSYQFDKSKINIDFFKLFLKSRAFKKLVETQTKSGIKTELKAKKFLILQIPLPDLALQLHLKKKIESLLNQTSEISRLTDLNAGHIVSLRQCVLQEAIQGKLGTRGKNDKAAEDELQKIRVNNKRKVPAQSHEEKLFELPSGWTWCKLAELCDIVRGGSPRPAGSPEFYGGDIPFLKVGDLTADDQMYLTKHTYTIKKAGLVKTRQVKANTLMLTNSGATLGIPKICTFDTTFNDGIAAFLNLPESIDMEYLYFFLKTKTNWFLSYASRGQGQPNLNTDLIGMTMFHFPPFNEQKRIVNRIKELMKLCDDLEFQITDSLAKSHLLTNAILAEQFKTQ